MKMTYANWLGRLAASAAAGVVAVAVVHSASAQAPRPANKAAKAAPGEVREEARDAAQATREGARDTAEGARRAAEPRRDAVREGREAVREGREEGREIRREGREDAREARDLTNSRPADFGLWFNSRGGADGLVIADIAAQGAISKIGFQEGDRIVSINGQRVADEREFMRYLLADDIRTQRVKVIVFRGGREQILYVQPSVLVTEVADYDPLWRYGIVVDDRHTDRIVVLRVYPRTPAYYAGLRAGDVVVGSRGQRFGAVADLVRIFTNSNDRVALQVSRGDRMRELQIDANVDAEARTSLRPNIDGGTRTRVEGDVEGRTPAPADDRPNLDRPRTDRPRTDKPATDKPDAADPATPATPATPRVKPATPATPAAPATPAPKPARPEAPAVPDTAPEAPPAPEAPRAPEAPKPPRLP